MPLNQNSATPLYQQLIDEIKANLESSEYQFGSKIPSEQELIKKYDVSRITVRKAIDELCAQGVLVRKQGKGTFVAKPKLHRKIINVLSFEDACKACNMKASHQLLTRKVTHATAEEARYFGLHGDLRLIFIQRLLCADNDPIMLENTLFPYEKYNFLLDEDLSQAMYPLLEKRGVRPSDTTSCTLEMVRATENQSNLLNIPIGEPLFYLASRLTLADQTPSAMSHNYIVGSRYQFNIP